MMVQGFRPLTTARPLSSGHHLVANPISKRIARWIGLSPIRGRHEFPLLTSYRTRQLEFPSTNSIATALI